MQRSIKGSGMPVGKQKNQPSRRKAQLEPTLEGLQDEKETTNLKELEAEIGKASVAKRRCTFKAPDQRYRTRREATFASKCYAPLCREGAKG